MNANSYISALHKTIALAVSLTNLDVDRKTQLQANMVKAYLLQFYTRRIGLLTTEDQKKLGKSLSHFENDKQKLSAIDTFFEGKIKPEIIDNIAVDELESITKYLIKTVNSTLNQKAKDLFNTQVYRWFSTT